METIWFALVTDALRGGTPKGTVSYLLDVALLTNVHELQTVAKCCPPRRLRRRISCTE